MLSFPHLRTIDSSQRRLIDRGHGVRDSFVDAGIQMHLPSEISVIV
jgi:hypothetical protein